METAEEKHAEDIPAFQAAVRKGVTDPFPYERLMVHYRKTKAYAKELEVINKAIKSISNTTRTITKQKHSRVAKNVRPLKN